MSKRKVTFTRRALAQLSLPTTLGSTAVAREVAMLQPAQTMHEGTVMTKAKKTEIRKLDAAHDVAIEETRDNDGRQIGWRYEVMEGRKRVLSFRVGADWSLDQVAAHAANELALHQARTKKVQASSSATAPVASWKTNAQFMALKLRVLDVARQRGGAVPSDEAILDVVVACGLYPEALSGLARLAAETAKIAEGS